MKVLADFYVPDVDFGCKIISGEFIETMNNVNGFFPNTEPDIDEGLSFLDEMKLE